MDKATAAHMIDGLKFMPGWRFRALDFNLPDTIMVRLLIDTVNSDHDKAIMDYPQHITLERVSMIHPEDYADADELAGAIFQWILEIMIHESREFLRLGTENLRAPFHPHRPEGETNWKNHVVGPRNPMRGLLVLNV